MIHWGYCLKTHWNVLITTYGFMAYINSIVQIRLSLTFTWYDDEELLVYAFFRKKRDATITISFVRKHSDLFWLSSIFRKEKTQNHDTLVVSVIILHCQLVQPRSLNERKFVASVEMEARNKWIRHFLLIWSWSWAI